MRIGCEKEADFTQEVFGRFLGPDHIKLQSRMQLRNNYVTID